MSKENITKILKKQKIIAMIMIAVFLFSAVSLCVVRIVESSQNIEQTDLNVSAAYTITDESSLSSNYDSYNEFHIYSPDGFKAFANSVYSYTGCDHSFLGKTVVLKSDIELGGESISIGATKTLGSGQYYVTTDPTFKGTFDGNGKTILNYQINGGCRLGGYSISGNTSVHTSVSLFPRVTGTIKNLRVSNVKTVSGVSGGYGGHTIGYQSALVAMLDGGTISNCIVDGFSGATYGAGIVAASYDGKVNNCYSTNISATNKYGIGPNIDKTYGNNNSPALTENFTCTISNCVTTENAVSILSTTTNCHTTANTTTGLNCNSVGGEYDATATDGTQTLWYYGANDYNNGYPYLRMFIEDWTYIQIQNVYKKIKLKLDNVEQESYIDLLVPPEVKTFPSTTTSTILNICNRTIEAFSLNPNRYRVAGFTFISSPFPRYLSRYEDITNNLTFNWCGNAKMTMNGTEVTETQVLKLFADEVITVTYTELSKEGTYLTITFTIADPVENTTRTVTYTANALYYLTGQDLTTETEITLSGDKTVTVTCVEKTYTPNFG